MYGPPADAQTLVSCIEQVVGPVQALNGFYDVGNWRLSTSLRGQPLQILVHTYKSRLSALSFGLSLGGRPIALSIHDCRTSLVGMQPVATGDPDFDRRYRVWGWPTEVLRVLLDPSTRQWVTARYGDRDPGLRTEEGFLYLKEPLATRHGLRTIPRVPPPDELAAWFADAARWAERAVAAFDQAHAAIVAAQGSAAATAWVQHHVELARAREGRRSAFRVAVLLGVGGCALLVLLLVLAVTLLFALR